MEQLKIFQTQCSRTQHSLNVCGKKITRYNTVSKKLLIKVLNKFTCKCQENMVKIVN